VNKEFNNIIVCVIINLLFYWFGHVGADRTSLILSQLKKSVCIKNHMDCCKNKKFQDIWFG